MPTETPDDTTFLLYTKTGCPWCADAIDYLREAGYEFDATPRRSRS